MSKKNAIEFFSSIIDLAGVAPCQYSREVFMGVVRDTLIALLTAPFGRDRRKMVLSEILGVSVGEIGGVCPANLYEVSPEEVRRLWRIAARQRRVLRRLPPSLRGYFKEAATQAAIDLTFLRRDPLALKGS